MLEGGTQRTRGNMLLGVAVAILSIVGLGTNVYKHNTGENVEWFSKFRSLRCSPQHCTLSSPTSATARIKRKKNNSRF